MCGRRAKANMTIRLATPNYQGEPDSLSSHGRTIEADMKVTRG